MKKCKYYILFLILASLLVFYYIISYYQMRKGDDILFLYYMGFQHYLDDVSWIPDEKILTIGQAFSQYVQYYLTFSGRIMALFQGYLFNLLGERVISVISSIVYVGTIASVCRIGLKSWEKVIKSPVLLLLCSLYMYQLTVTGVTTSMWTFVCHYAIPVLLYLIYYLLVSKAYLAEKVLLKQKIVLFCLGVLCGLCHECLSAFLILMVIIKALTDSYIRKTMSIKRIGINIGLCLGYLIIFVAPGNYKRLQLNHDSDRASMNVWNKVMTSVHSHIEAAGLLKKNDVLIFILLGMIVIWIFIKSKKTIKEYIKDNIEFLVVCVISVPIWAVFAPPVPHYGLQLWKACVVILLLRVIDVDILKEKYWNIIGTLGLIVCIASQVGWLSDLISVTVEWREEISQAVRAGDETVYVDRYPETTNNFLTEYNYVNNGFASDCEVRYYGIIIRVNDLDADD